MYLPLLDEKQRAVFSPVAKGKEDHSAQEVEYGDSGLIMEFKSDLPKSEIEKAIRARFPKGSATPTPGRLKFDGWSVEREAVDLPYRWVLAAGLALVFLGLIFVVRGVGARR